MAEPLWTAEELAAAVDGRFSAGGFSAAGVSIDTRTLEPGDLFVALAGARDGHDFVGQAMAKGAAGALVTREVDAPGLLVADTFEALQALGVAARNRASQARRGAITGSVGKTSVTQAVAAGLALAGRAHASVKSYNNHIGVPLTLARMPRDTERAVFEIGMNHAEEIVPLSRMVAPEAVAITTVGPVHTENFADGEAGVARAKAEIFAGLQHGGTAVLNADNRWFEFLKAEAVKVGARVVAFGETEGSEARLLAFEPDGEGAVVRGELHGRPLRFTLRQSGHHWGLNSLAALALLEALGVEPEIGVQALADFAPLEGRGAVRTIRLAGGAFTLIDESYNANPISLAATLRTLGARPAQKRRIVALTDMLELGPEAGSLHAGLASGVEAAGVDLVFCAGPLMRSLWEALPPTRRGGYGECAAQLRPQLVSAVEPGDLVMVKGSHGSKAWMLAEALAALDVGGEPGKGG